MARGYPGRVRPARQRALHLAAAVPAVRAAVLRLPPAVLAAAPRPARAAVVLGLARVLQPRAHLRLGAAHLPAAALPARAHARAAAPRARAAARGRAPLRLLVPAPWLALGVVFLLGFRIALNVTDSNVIDVGYAGVIGAQRIVDGKPLYGGYPADNEHGDTYGPVNYEAYVPFEQIFGWSGTWDDLPAAHAAAIFFDLLAVALLFLLGRRMRGPTLGIALAYAWVVLPVHAVRAREQLQRHARRACSCSRRCSRRATARARRAGARRARGARRPDQVRAARARAAARDPRPARARRAGGAALALAGAVRCSRSSPPPRSRRSPRSAHDSLHTIYERTIVYQANRGSPFSVWGLYGGLGGLQLAVAGRRRRARAGARGARPAAPTSSAWRRPARR